MYTFFLILKINIQGKETDIVIPITSIRKPKLIKLKSKPSGYEISEFVRTKVFLLA